jgi:prophage maintenance system killer protein
MSATTIRPGMRPGLLAVEWSASTAGHCSGCPSSTAFFLDFELACEAVAAARAAAVEVGTPRAAPPTPLEECNRGTVEIALHAPFAGMADREFYPELEQKAAVLVFTLAKSQACSDGNKRVAAILLEAFLALNHRTLETSEDELENMIRTAESADAAERDDTLDRLTDWLRDSIAPLSEEDEA